MQVDLILSNRGDAFRSQLSLLTSPDFDLILFPIMKVIKLAVPPDLYQQISAQIS